MGFDVLAARRDLPSATASVYLNAGTFGPLPRPAHEAMLSHMGASYTQGRIGFAGFQGWLAQMDAARAAFGRSLGVSPDELALTHCTTDGLNTVLWGLDLKAGDEVLTTTHEHPGLTAPLDEVARVRGIRVRMVEPARIAEEVRPETRLVAVSHVLWTTGEVLPLPAIAAAARAHGAQLLVDGAQSTGAIPVDLHASGADFYTVSGQKWFCGPSGTGALWVRPSALAGLGTPWPWYLSQSRSSKGAEPWTTARRLDASTISMTSLAGIIGALGWHKEQVDAGALGWAAARATDLRARLQGLSKVRLIPVQNASTIVSFTVEGVSAAAVAGQLEKLGVLVRSIPGVEYVRAAVGFWNDDGDLTRLVAGLG